MTHEEKSESDERNPREHETGGHEHGSGKFIPYSLPRLSPDEMVARSREFYEEMATRRSARVFSSEPVPLEA
ncbi:MAG: hypothetical protein ACPH97_05725, partial [Flavobacteriales bacterium]